MDGGRRGSEGATGIAFNLKTSGRGRLDSAARRDFGFEEEPESKLERGSEESRDAKEVTEELVECDEDEAYINRLRESSEDTELTELAYPGVGKTENTEACLRERLVW